MKKLADKTVEVTLKKDYNYYGAKKKKGEKIVVREDMVSSLVRNGFIDAPEGEKTKKITEVK